MRDHADRGSKLAEISPWNFPDDFPMECTANHKTLYRAYYWFIVDIDQHFSIKSSPTIVYCLFRSLSSPTITRLACEIIHLAYISGW